MYNPRKRLYMPMLQIEGSNSAKGLRGLAKDSGHRAAVKDAQAALGGKLEGVCYPALALAGFNTLDRVAVRWGRSNLLTTRNFQGSMWTPSTEMI